MFNCKLSRNISLNPDGSSTVGGDCGSAEIASGGIQERVFVYNIDDIENLMFEDDMRYDNNLIIDTIITSKAYYYIDSTDATYNEEQNGTKHRHRLTITVANTQPITEDTLNEAVHHRYLVAYRPKGAELYRVFGWKEGAGMSYVMDIDESTNSYTITLSDESEYALMSCLADNFDLENKVFTPIFKPLYDVSYCEVGQGNQRTGYCIASYVVKVNSAGQALDNDNKLCYYSGNQQDAYKYQGVADGDYHILGTYTDTASFDGVPVKIFDVERCPIDAHGTISVSSSTIKLNSTTTTQECITLSSDNAWEMVENLSTASVNPTSGSSGNTTVCFYTNGTGCNSSKVRFRNKTTYEIAEVDVEVNIIKVNEEYTYLNGTTEFDITPIVEPSGSDYTYSIDQSGLTITKQSDGTLHFVVNNPSNEYQTYTLTLTHSNDAREKKYVAINLLGNNTDPVWRMMARYCEEGTPTQYRWVTVSGQYVCVGYDKHTEEKQQQSMDGETWTDVVPLQTRAGSLIEANSEDCGYVPPTPPTPTTEYRWVVVDGQYECVGYDKYSVEKKQQSTDGGTTWTDVVPTETRTGSVIEYNSEDCGYVPPTPGDYENQYLTFEALENGTFTFTGRNGNSLSYSIDDGQTWTAGNSVEVNSGDKVLWKGTASPSTYFGIGGFSATGNFDVQGNPMSLLFGDNFVGQTDLTGKNYALSRLFSNNSKVINAENLSLPATTLADGCYSMMFYGCESLVNAPELPATTLAQYCYGNMFQFCRSLTTAPELPATTLADGCYSNMFYECTSLVNAPSVLPATTLADNCYYRMFIICTSLTTVPDLPSTTLTSNCYEEMFYGCTNLNNIKCLATDISATNCTRNWVDGVAASGTFTKAANMSSWTTGDNGIPSGWTVINE